MATQPVATPFTFTQIGTHRPTFMGRKQMVSSGHYLASMAGFRMLEAGGNAVDAGVAAGICINVVQPDMTNFGGVAPMIMFMADRQEVVTISGLGRWPRKATVDYFKEQHGGKIPIGIVRCVTPAAAGAWLMALELYGTKSFAEVAAPALELAENGFPVHQFIHDNLAKWPQDLAKFPYTHSIYYPNGRVPRQGELLREPDLARTFRRLMEAEAKAAGTREQKLRAAKDFFYKGEIAREMAAFSKAEGGLMEYEDIAEFSPRVEAPCRTTYKGYEAFSCGPWCQGPSVLEAINILEGYDLPSLGHNSAEYLHLIASAIDAAYSDRHAYYGDPDFVKVPMAGLLSKEYAAVWRSHIVAGKAFDGMPEAGDAWRYQGEPDPGELRGTSPRPLNAPPGPDTSYCCAVDRWGNGFSCTPSDGATGAPLVPGLGIMMSSRGYQSWVDETHPCRVEGGKRPRLTPNPALLLKDGKLAMVLGSPGLDAQPQAMVQVLMGILEFGWDPQTAIERPRVVSYNYPSSADPHPYFPNRLCAEGRIPAEVREALARMGHRVETWPEWLPTAGSVCAIRVDPEKGLLLGGADPRRMSYAVGW